MEVLHTTGVRKERASDDGYVWDSLALPKLFEADSEGTRKRLLSNATNQAVGHETYDENAANQNASVLLCNPLRLR